MIRQLFIQDYAVIDKLDLEFDSGLNLLTGETGAGKSIVVDAIGIALGERADSDAVRSGRDKAIVEAVIEVDSSPEALEILEEAGISRDNGSIVISREIQKSGKSQCRINGRPSTVSLLKEITDRLVDTHGQHEHQFLLRADRHLSFLDAWCGQEVSSLKAEVSKDYSELCRLKNELADLRSNERERARMIDLYQFQAQEINQAALNPGEEEELLADKTKLANAEKLHAASAQAFSLLSDRVEEGCALDMLNEAVINLQELAMIDSSMENLREMLQAAIYQIEDVSRELSAYRDSVEFNPERLEDVEGRLDIIRTLKRKYGDSIEEIIEYGKDLDRKLDMLVNSEERTEELENKINNLEGQTISKAEKLSQLRQKGGEIFAQAVEKELGSLGMTNAVFVINQIRGELSHSGIDKAEFIFSANPGEPPRPLAKIASGGEMSRVMLGIKSVMASVDCMPTLVFDEVDVGVGGRTAEVIGLKLKSLAEKSQVLCITHLPQIASLPGRHFFIEKQLADNRTVVRVRQLSEDARISELARMLGGEKPSVTAVQHAKEMLGIN